MHDERTSPSLGHEALLARFHRVLVDEIRRNRPQYLKSSFTVSEIYQSLVPYRSHRDLLGVEMNGDYEDALLRLLGGVGDYLVLDSPPARDEIRKELASGNPDRTLYREFAAVEVRLNPDRLPPEGETPSPEPAPTPLAASDGTAIDPSPDAAGEADGGIPGEPVRPPDRWVGEGSREAPTFAFEEDASTVGPTGAGDSSLHPDTPSARRPENCPSCGSGLPDRSSLRFCPHCGSDVFVLPCPGCGEAVEPGWRFCIGCGTEVTR